MTTRLRIAARIFPALVMQDVSLAIEKPEVMAQRALMLADALLQCDSICRVSGSSFDPDEPGLSARLAHRRQLLLPGAEMMRPSQGATRH